MFIVYNIVSFTWQKYKHASFCPYIQVNKCTCLTCRTQEDIESEEIDTKEELTSMTSASNMEVSFI